VALTGMAGKDAPRRRDGFSRGGKPMLTHQPLPLSIAPDVPSGGSAASDPMLFLSVAAAYDRWSAFYDSYDNPLLFAADQVVEALAGQIAGLDLVEFGCGTGRHLARLGPRGAASLTGCDLSPGMLAQARSRVPAARLLLQDMMQPLPLADGSADLVLFCLALEHVGDLHPPLREARRLLRPGGRVALIEIHPVLSFGAVGAHFRDQETVVRMPTFAHGFADYVAALLAAGLTLTACREWRPRDLAGPLPSKVLKRGPDGPLLLELELRRDQTS